MTTDPQTSEIAVAPCPFCGGEARPIESGDDRWYVTCTEAKCYCSLGEIWDGDSMPDHHFRSEMDAIATWNRRAVPASEEMVLMPLNPDQPFLERFVRHGLNCYEPERENSHLSIARREWHAFVVALQGDAEKYKVRSNVESFTGSYPPGGGDDDGDTDVPC